MIDPPPTTADLAIERKARIWGLLLLAICLLPWAFLEDGTVLFAWDLFLKHGKGGAVLAYLLACGLLSFLFGMARDVPRMVRSLMLFSLGSLPLCYFAVGLSTRMAVFFLSCLLLPMAVIFRLNDAHATRASTLAGNAAVGLGFLTCAGSFIAWHGFTLAPRSADSLASFLAAPPSPASLWIMGIFEWIPALLALACLVLVLPCSERSSPDSGSSTSKSSSQVARAGMYGLLYYQAAFPALLGLAGLVQSPSTMALVLPTFVFPAIYLGAFFTFAAFGGVGLIFFFLRPIE